MRKPDDEMDWRARPSIGRWPLFAILGGLGTGIAWLVVVYKDAPTRYAGLAWLAAGFVFYPLYRRRLGEPLRATVRAPVVITADRPDAVYAAGDPIALDVHVVSDLRSPITEASVSPSRTSLRPARISAR